SRKEEPKTGKKGTRNGNLANLTSRSDTAEVWGMLNAPRGGALDFRRHIRREPEVAVGPKRPTTAEDSAQGELGDLPRRSHPADEARSKFGFREPQIAV